MRPISKQTVDLVREKSDILEVVSSFLSLKKVGSKYSAKSPFNRENTASFFVVPDKGIFKDFSSGKGGDSISFLMEHERMTFPEAILWLADKFKVPVEYENGTPTNNEDTKRYNIANTNKKVLVFFLNQWIRHDYARQYILDRGFSVEEVKKYALGYAPKSYDLLHLGISPEQLIEAGIAMNTQRGLMNTIRDRIVFPIVSITGKVVGFTSRIVIDQPDAPKYLHGSNNVLFEKKNHCYGLFWSKKFISERNKCFMVEGPMDYHAMARVGYENTVATLGTSITEQQIKQVKRFTDNITMLYDPDKAGKAGSVNAIKIGLSLGVLINFCALPQGKDPDALARLGRATLDQVLLRETDCASAIVYLSGFDDSLPTADKFRALGLISEIISATTDTVLRELLSVTVSKKVKTSPEALLNAVNKHNNLKPDFYQVQDKDEDQPIDLIDIAESKLMALLRYQGNTECVMPAEEGVIEGRVYQVVQNVFREVNFQLVSQKFSGYNDIIMGLNDSTASTAFASFPAIVNYGFFEREKKELSSTALKYTLDVVFAQIVSKPQQSETDHIHKNFILRKYKHIHDLIMKSA